MKSPVVCSLIKLVRITTRSHKDCEYALNRKGSADIIFSNGKPAKVTNPTNRPQVCKHLFHLGEVLIMRSM